MIPHKRLDRFGMDVDPVGDHFAEDGRSRQKRSADHAWIPVVQGPHGVVGVGDVADPSSKAAMASSKVASVWPSETVTPARRK